MQFLNRILWLALAVAMPAGFVINASAEADLPVYVDRLANGFEDWGVQWAPHSYTNTSPVHSGTYSISASPNHWEGLYFHHPIMDTSPYTNLSFWVNGGTNGGQLIQVRALLGTNIQAGYPLPALQADKWQQFIIPLALFSAADATNFHGFWIQRCGGDSPAETFYLDDIQFGAKPTPAAVRVSIVEAPTPPVPAPAPAPIVAAPVVPPPSNDSNPAVWIIGALAVIISLLAWLGFILKRSAARALAAPAAPSGLLAEGGPSRTAVEPAAGNEWRERALAAEAVADKQAQIIRDELVPELTEFAKQSLVQGLSSQRKALLETHQKAQAELAKLEARLAELRLPLRERILMYENRIAELENELLTRGEEMSELIRATLSLVRQRLDEERQKDIAGSRSN